LSLLAEWLPADGESVARLLENHNTWCSARQVGCPSNWGTSRLLY